MFHKADNGALLNPRRVLNEVQEAYLGLESILEGCTTMQTSPPAKSFFSPAAAPSPPSRHPFDRDVALRRLGCMVDLTHGSLGDYSTVHNLYTSSIKNGNRAQTIQWMKQVSHLSQNFASSSVC
jgi:hypothetical protein